MFKSGLQLLESVAANMKMAPQFPPSARDNGSDDVRQISQPATITELPSDTAPEMTETQAVSEQHVEVVAKQQVESQLPTTVEITHTNDTPPVVAVRPISSDFDAELVACADEARLLESRLRHIVNHIQQHGVEAIREISLITDQPSNIEILDELYDVVFDYESSVGIVDMDAHRKSLAILNKACHLNVDIAMARSRLRYLSALEHSKVTSVDDQVVPASGPSIPPSLFSKLLDLAEEPIEKLQEIKKSQESETLVMAKQLAVARSTMLRPLLEEITVLERSMASQFGIEAAHNARIASLQAKSNEASVAVDDRQHLERQISQLELTLNDKLKNVNAEIESSKRRKAQYTSDLKALTAENDKLKRQVAALEKKNKIKSKKSNDTTKLDALTAEIGTKTVQLNKLNEISVTSSSEAVSAEVLVSEALDDNVKLKQNV